MMAERASPLPKNIELLTVTFEFIMDMADAFEFDLKVQLFKMTLSDSKMFRAFAVYDWPFNIGES